MQHFCLAGIDLQADPGTFLAEPGENALGRIGVATHERNVVCVGEGREQHGWVAGASVGRKGEAIIVMEAPPQNEVHHQDEEQRRERVPLENTRGGAEFVCGAIA